METILLQISKIVQETAQSKSFYFSLKDGNTLTYKAGQFITLLLNIGGRELRRSYSFGSSPGIDEYPFITIKRIENGIVSRLLFDNLEEGDVVSAILPAGRFTHVNDNADVDFFTAAGSGIVPVFSLLKETLYKTVSKVILIYQNTTEQSSIYRGMILGLKEEFETRFTLVELFSQPLENVHHPRRLNNYLFEQYVKKFVQTRKVMFYTCGPTQFMRMVQFTLRVMGYSDDQVKKENFVVDFIPNAPFFSDLSPRQVIIHFNRQTYTIEVAYPQNILEAALKNNIQLPYSCRGGRCSTCTARCIKGKIKMSINDVLTEKDIAKGLVLTCVGYPETDVELELE